MFPALWGWMFAQPLYRLTLKGRVPDGLRSVPPEPWPGDPALGRAILDSGTVPEGGHGFAWLVDMKAAARPNAADRARGLIAEWIADNRRWRADSWRPDVIGERLVNWFRCYDFLMTGADGDFRARFLAAVVEQARHLGRVVGRGPGGRRRMLAIKGLILSGLAVPGFEERMERAFRILQGEIALQVMADGGHASRSPLGQLEVLRDLVEMRGALIGARWQVPDGLQGAIDRMTPMLRALRLGDGRLALFNGSWEDTDERIEQALAEAGGRARPVANAPHSGFQRLAAGRTIVIADVGPPRFVGDYPAHAGTLSFEMSHAKKRVVVNCGNPPAADARWRELLRATAAHSTLTVGDVHSSDLEPGGGLGKRRAVASHVDRREDNGAVLVEASHDGYKDLFGLTHHRRLYLDAEGGDIRGEDRLSGPGGQVFAVRFHLHPDVQASLIQSGDAALVRPAGGKGWRFRASGGGLAIEESVYFGAGERRRSRQLVVAGRHAGGASVVKWRFSLET